MPYSEDPSSPAAPFTGDGSIFDYPDAILEAPTTNERVVDTQSGFLVVIKRMGDRMALSCKRLVGTPPTSTVLLTPDESLKLSKILASSIAGLEDSAESGLAHSARAQLGGRRRFPFTGATSSGRKPTARQAKRPVMVAGIVAVVGVVLATGFGIGYQVAPGKASGAVADSEPLSAVKIDKFARLFVSDMLDFNPETYKLSQIQAMSYMSPELVEKYWKETNFPLTRRQLKSLPQGTTVMINKIAQEPVGEDGLSVRIFADLVRPDSKMTNPVHIRLKIGLGEDGNIQVLEQEDITAAAVTPAE